MTFLSLNLSIVCFCRKQEGTMIPSCRKCAQLMHTIYVGRSETENKADTQSAPIRWFTPQMSGSQRLKVGLPRGCQRPNCLYHHLLSPMLYISRKSEWTAELGHNPGPQQWDVGIPSTGANTCPGSLISKNKDFSQVSPTTHRGLS